MNAQDKQQLYDRTIQRIEDLIAGEGLT